jgi:hypothetical protein
MKMALQKTVKRLRSLLRSSLVYDTWKHMRAKPSGIFYSVLFDAFFVFLAWLFGTLLGELTAGQTGNALFYRMAYLAVFIAAYSSLKFMVLKTAKSFFGRDSLAMEKIWRLIVLNIFVLGFSLAVFALLNLLALASVKKEALPAVGISIYVVMLVFAYLFINLSHSAFASDGMAGMKAWRHIWKSFWAGIKAVFLSFRRYYPVVVLFVIASVLLALLSIVLDIAIRLALKPEVLSAQYLNIALGLAYFSVAVYYAVHVFSRVYLLRAISKG